MKRGFTLIEIMLAIALSMVILPALVNVLGFSLTATKQGERYTKAYAMAQEQMEAIYDLKEKGDTNWDWTTKPVETSTGEYYQPALVSGEWQLGAKTTTPAAINGFTKKVEIVCVKRDGSGNVDNSGTCDDVNYPSKLVTVYVEWEEKGQDERVEITSLVSEH